DLSQAACKQPTTFTDPLSKANWNGWSPSSSNARFQSAAGAGLDAGRVPQLKLKWVFAFPGDVIAFGHPTVAGGRVFVGSSGRRLYSLDQATGCIHWSYTTDAAVRAAISIGAVTGSNSGYAAYFGDLAANMYAVDAATGKLLWKTKVDDHRAARITGAP